MSLANWFETFCSSIKMSSETTNTISYRYKQLTKRLNYEFWNTDSDLYHSFYVGSYGRETEIFASDIDMLFQLPYDLYQKYNSYQTNGQSALLQVVKNAIMKTYSDSFLKSDGQIIQVRFTDGINFEVLPAFVNKDGTYTYADSNNNGSWKITDPKTEIKAINDRDIEANKNLKILCKMMRAWANNMDVPIKGLLIDTLAYQFLEKYNYKDKSYLYYDYFSRDFFYLLKNQDKDQTFWRAPGSARYVYNPDNFRWKATRAYNISMEAIAYAEKKQDYSAKSKWREIYGTKFPA